MAKAVRKSPPTLNYQGVNQSVVINHLDVRPVVRQVLDIQKWRNAMVMAEGLTQNRVGLYDIYTDVLLDLILFRAIEKRIIHITNLPIVFIDNDGKRNEAIGDLMKELFFRQMLRHIMESIFWGHSLIELNWTEPEPNTKLVARKHVKPRYKIVTTNQHDTFGVDYNDNKAFYNYIEVGDPEDLGLLLKVTPYALWKRADIGDWSEFIELFGMPSTLGKYTNPETRKLLRDAFEKMGGRPRLVVPNDAQVEMQESKSANGDGGLFNTFREALNEEMTIGVLGNTMTTIEAKSSGYAQSETQQKDQNELKKDDRAFAISVLNGKVRGYLIREGFTKGGAFQFVDDEHLSMSQRLAIDIQLNDIVPIDASYWYEKYKLPMPTAQPESKSESIVPKKKPKKSENLNLNEQDGGDGAANDWLRSLYSDNHGNDAMIRHYYDRLNAALREAVSTEVGIKYGQDWAFNIGLQSDAMRFAIFKNHAAKDEMLKLMTTDSGMLKPFSTWKKDVASIVGDYNQNWLQAEYQTAVASARMGVKWQQFERRKSIYPNLHYKTQHDDRVRPSHALMDGIIRPMDDVFWKTNYPPNGWRCRCNVIQTDLPPTEVLPEGESLPPPAFQHNSGITGRLFAPYHPYYEVSAQNKEASERIATQLQNQAHEAHAKESAQAVLKSFMPKQFELNGKQATVSNSVLTVLDSDFEPKLKAIRNYCLLIVGEISQQLQFSEIANGLHYYLYSFDYFGEAFIFKLVFDEYLNLKNIIL
jgi:SPP1 gp7 family putative phage head morphogenesis protein